MMSMPVIRVVVIAALLLIMGWGYFYQLQQQQQAKIRSDDPRLWQNDIEAMLTAGPAIAQDVTVLLLGDGWPLAAGLASPLLVDRRVPGFKILDLRYYLDQLLPERAPGSVVVTIGGVDFNPQLNPRRRSAEQQAELLSQLAEKIVDRWPGIALYIVLPGVGSPAEAALRRALDARVAEASEWVLLPEAEEAGPGNAYWRANELLAELLNRQSG